MDEVISLDVRFYQRTSPGTIDSELIGKFYRELIVPNFPLEDERDDEDMFHKELLHARTPQGVISWDNTKPSTPAWQHVAVAISEPFDASKVR